MSDQLLSYIWNGLLTFFVVVVGGFAKHMFGEQTKLKEAHGDLRETIAKDYVTKEDLLRSENATKDQLNRLVASVDTLSAKFDRFLEREMK